MFKQKYPPQLYQFIKDNREVPPAKLRRAIHDLLYIDIPKKSMYNMVKHYGYGIRYARQKHNTPSWFLKPLGTERLDKDGYVKVLTKDGEKLKHHLVWLQAGNKLDTKTECLLFLDCDKTNCNIDNLMLVKRKYIGAINNLAKLTLTPELRKTAITSVILYVEAKEKKDRKTHLKNKERKPEINKLVWDLHCQGLSNGEIAEKTGLSKMNISWKIRRKKLEE